MQSQLSNGQLTSGPYSATATFPALYGGHPPQPTQANIPGSSHPPPTPIPHSNQTESRQTCDVGSDSDLPPRFSATEKGKQRARPWSPMLEEEHIPQEAEGFGGYETPTLHAATEVMSFSDRKRPYS